MRRDTRFLSSKVARRIFLLFVVCALVPITGLAAYSFGRVSRQLYAQSEYRRDDAVREIAQGMVQRLQLLDTELRLLAQDSRTAAAGLGLLEPSGQDHTPRFLAVAILGADGSVSPVFGDPELIVPPPQEARSHLQAGRALLVGNPRRDAPPILLLSRLVSAEQPGGPTIVGQVNPVYLWTGAEDTLGSQELCIFDAGGRSLWCTQPPDGVVPAAVRTAITRSSSGTLEWSVDDADFLASFWSIPMDYQFGVSWTVMLSEARSEVLRPMEGFRYFFTLIVLVSFWVVLLLSIGQIRRSLVPLERLRAGTQQIADRQFHSRVEVSSGDEFEELADSFNDMARRLGKQFNALTTIAEIDRVILSTLDIESIVGAVLRHTIELVDCHALSVTLVPPGQRGSPRTYALKNGPAAQPTVETTRFEASDGQRFASDPDRFELTPGQRVPVFLEPLARAGCDRFVVLPMFIGEAPAGAIALGFAGSVTTEQEDLHQVRQLTDQVAVALANAHLVQDLDALNWGALTALARAVDAKSPWTAGHSERVAHMGMRIGEQLGLDRSQIDLLHRGGLLHDIGKIGVPARILDKAGPLTEEEFRTMQRHPEIGANILQPIDAYADVIPIVREHHERWDGSGYPDGLVGEQIHLYARIFAVADVYDAIISNRPYRVAQAPRNVVQYILDNAGTEFDPQVVAAFLEVMIEEGLAPLSAQRA